MVVLPASSTSVKTDPKPLTVAGGARASRNKKGHIHNRAAQSRKESLWTEYLEIRWICWIY